MATPQYDPEESTSLRDDLGGAHWPGLWLFIAFLLMLGAAALDRTMRLFRIPKRDTSPSGANCQHWHPETARQAPPKG